MNPWTCAALIAAAGALGGAINALISDNGFALPRYRHGIWCLGFLSNVLVGAFAAFSSWSFYGSGAAIDLVDVSRREKLSLTFSALAGALLVGVAGAKWITNEVDKQLLKETVKIIGPKQLSREQCEEIVKGSPMEVLRQAEDA
jgi:hypothetical protein